MDPQSHFIIGTYMYRENLFHQGRHFESVFALLFQEAGEVNAAFDSPVWDQFHRVCFHPRASEDRITTSF